MKMEEMIRVIAGSLILISPALAYAVNPNGLWFTVFVGANLLQSGITKGCLMETILAGLGVETQMHRFGVRRPGRRFESGDNVSALQISYASSSF